MQTWDGTGEVWRGPIIEWISTTFKATIAKERGPRVEKTEGSSNDKHALPWEFGIDPEVDGSEAPGRLGEARRGHGRHRPQCNQGAYLWLLDDVALLRVLADGPLHVEETDLVEGNAPISIL